MDYCCPVWFATTKEEISALEGIQRSLTSRIQSLKGFSYWERLRKLKLMSVQRRRERYIIIHMWKIYTGTAPNDIKIQFHYNDRTGPQCIVPNLNARSSRINTLRYNFFTSMGPRLFNSLPKAVKECKSFTLLKVGGLSVLSKFTVLRQGREVGDLGGGGGGGARQVPGYPGPWGGVLLTEGVTP